MNTVTSVTQGYVRQLALSPKVVQAMQLE